MVKSRRELVRSGRSRGAEAPFCLAEVLFCLAEVLFYLAEAPLCLAEKTGATFLFKSPFFDLSFPFNIEYFCWSC